MHYFDRKWETIMFNNKLVVHKHPSDQIESPWEGAGGREGRATWLVSPVPEEGCGWEERAQALED